jgi:crotonobetainyl-CoA:carnitine CoA-transferase CaiB-like acyl-CoA transferase
VLSDLGADVVKLERIGGDPVRAMGSVNAMTNRGKRGIAVDLKRPEGAEIADRLIKWADVVHHNWRPGVADRLGLGYDRVRKLNPRVIYGASPGFGNLGPYRNYAAFEPLVSTRAGLMFYGQRPGDLPRSQVGSNMDWGNAVILAATVIMALTRRTETGSGCYIETPEYAAAMYTTSQVYLTENLQTHGEVLVDEDGLGVGDPFNRLYRTATDWIAVCAVRPQAREQLIRVTGTGIADPAQPSHETVESFKKVFASRPADEWISVLTLAGVPAEPVGSSFIQEALDDERYVRSGLIGQRDDPVYGSVKELGLVFRLDRTPGRTVVAPAPKYGQDNWAVLGELGYAADEIARLEEMKVLESEPGFDEAR